MIVKSIHLNYEKLYNNRAILLYGNNQGHKDQIINDYLLPSYKGEIIRLDETELLDKINEIIEAINDYQNGTFAKY